MVKMLAFGDLHGHIYREFNHSSDLTGSTRLDSIISVLRQMKVYCTVNKIKHVLFAGDLYHTRGRVSTVVYNAIYDEIKSFTEEGIEVLMIPGNHDDTDNSDLPKHSLHTFKDIEGITVVDTLKVVEFGGQKIACCRYSKNTEMIMDFINGINEKDDVTLLGHLGISGAFVGKGSYPMQDAFSLEDLRPDYFKFIILGHFHKKQYLGGDKRFLYTGSPLQHSFNDEGATCGFHVIDFIKEDTMFIKSDAPEFVTLDYGNLAIRNNFEELMFEHYDYGDFVRIIMDEKDLPVLETIEHKPQYKLVLTKSYEEQLRIDVRVGMSEEEVVTKYAEEHNPAMLKIGLEILAEVKSRV